MMTWLLNNSLWLVAIGLCLASSGLDGAYMAAWMSPSVAWLGYILNTVSDVAGMAIMFHYGRLRQTRQNEAGGKRKVKMARVLVAVEVIAVAYSWFFGWRQLRIVLPAIEPENWGWIAPVAAGFIPLLLAAIGYTQALLAGRIESVQDTSTETGEVKRERAEATQSEDAARVQSQIFAESEVPATHSDNGSEHFCPYCDAPFGSAQAVSAHLRWCDSYQAQRAEAQAE